MLLENYWGCFEIFPHKLSHIIVGHSGSPRMLHFVILDTVQFRLLVIPFYMYRISLYVYLDFTSTLIPDTKTKISYQSFITSYYLIRLKLTKMISKDNFNP